MYLSHLLVDCGDNPDRPRPGRFWLHNVYHVHQRLCMAFPSSNRKGQDLEFLNPYRTDDFTQGQVHVSRTVHAGFLFRIDAQPGSRALILVQSAMQPDWDYAFQNARYLLAAPPLPPRPFQLKVEPGVLFRFRLLANPVRKVSDNSLGADGKPIDPRWRGKHVPVPSSERELQRWLERRAAPSGFRLRSLESVQLGYVYVNKTRDSSKGQRFRSARFDGLLEVTDSRVFAETLAAGIGPAKAFGFGLLSLARAED